MKITADTNLLVRAAANDDAQQSPLAAAMLRDAELVAIALPTLCEFVWVLKGWYKKDALDVVQAIRRLIGSARIQVDRVAVEAGLSILEKGGDFADGLIAFEGRRLGGEIFVSFDRTACKLIEAAGGATNCLSDEL